MVVSFFVGLLSVMTAQQIAKAQELARNWKPKQ